MEVGERATGDRYSAPAGGQEVFVYCVYLTLAPSEPLPSNWHTNATINHLSKGGSFLISCNYDLFLLFLYFFYCPDTNN